MSQGKHDRVGAIEDNGPTARSVHEVDCVALDSLEANKRCHLDAEPMQRPGHLLTDVLLNGLAGHRTVDAQPHYMAGHRQHLGHTRPDPVTPPIRNDHRAPNHDWVVQDLPGGDHLVPFRAGNRRAIRSSPGRQDHRIGA